MTGKDREGASAVPAKAKHLSVRLQWEDIEQTDLFFSDQMHLSRINDQYYLTFGQVRPKLVAKEGVLDGSIRPLVRLVVPKEALMKLTLLLKGGLEEGEE